MHVHQTLTEEHRSKRKFQPSITSYFAARDQFDDNEDLRGLDPITRPRHHHNNTRPAQQRERLAPDLPGQVQAELLSVGMRVRKSVPEGYKTNKMSLPLIQTTMWKPTFDVKPSREDVPDDYVHQRELLPFCGLHKIGGYAEQPTTNPHLYGVNGLRPRNSFPLPAEAFTQPFTSHSHSRSSPDNGYSMNPSRSHNPSKRSWQDEEDKPLQSNFLFAIPTTRGMGMGVEIDEVPVSPLSETPRQGLNMLPPARQLAQPKSRRAVQRTISDDDIDIDMDFENTTHMEARVSAGSGSDFEDADFLSGEVTMGDV
ncbi:hypothetical protein CFE70_004383 [Pyrenophora teres f. teres 0-1]|uniref:Uncharacterized protein n=2 Tax=Pyrenophora teres f. teres TaxID=97479 RepID=E3S6I7_PYRTT|nr:hypothetical protein PTT_18346 [Pyrenophora teres f. teres 0-1]KAE8833324.1 hypothetical protein HRS9139_05143 [Pyrenophora teres f. teres]KAE8840906.1 hypothetical protein PTNB85_04305 [Pyrenophora teres f. teres]KAE8848956.1 hypothetical protein HRS9122_02972 [Pyrenophora teres f. teres]KAE8864403.1 hypothetical protein PTNB29_04367 [Pyrenophora teres f. teres]